MNKSKYTTSIDTPNISCMYTAARTLASLLASILHFEAQFLRSLHLSGERGKWDGVRVKSCNRHLHPSPEFPSWFFRVADAGAIVPSKGRTKRQSCQDGYVSLNLNVCLVSVVHCCRRIRINMFYVTCTPIYN